MKNTEARSDNKKKRRLLLLVLAIGIAFTAGTVFLPSQAAYAASPVLKRPVIKSLTKSNNGFKVRSVNVKKAAGWQVRYSTSKKFSWSRTKKFSGTRLDARIGGLQEYKRYYVKIRSFRIKNGHRKYSKWSKVKRISTSSKPFDKYRAYTRQARTTLYSKRTYRSKKTEVWYNTKLYVAGVRTLSGTKWYRVYCNGKKYYLPMKKTSYWLSKKRSRYSYSGKTDLEREIIKKSMSIYNNWSTKYDFTHKADPEALDWNGRHSVDCSALVAYILNSVCQKYCPAYNVSRGDVEEYYTTDLVNGGFGETEFKVKTVCKGKISFSKLRPGDVIFFRQGYGHPIDHVGLYLGNREFLQSNTIYSREPESGRRGGVNIAPLRGMYADNFVCAKRFIPKSADEFKETGVVLVRKTDLTVYDDVKCTDGHEKCEIALPKGTKEMEFKVLYIGNRYYKGSDTTDKCAYIEYTDEAGNTEKGFVKVGSKTVFREASPEAPGESTEDSNQ